MRLNAGQRQYLTLTIVVSILLMAVLPIPGSQTSSSNEHNRFEYPQPAMVSQVIEDDIILVSDWIIVEAGHELIIDNSTIVFIHNEIAIIVQDGGVLSILDSLLYSYPSCSWWISAESGAELVIERSTLEGSGTSTQGGINVRCDNGVIDGCHVSEFGGDGINIGDCNGVRIQNNIVTSCSWEGIGFTQTSDLIISDNQVSDSGYCGIFGANSEDVIIEMNNISATTYSGVCLNHVATSEVTFNNFSEIRSDAICIEYCDNIDVEGNTVFSGYGCGILSVWSTHLLIVNNDIRETVYDGINLIAHSQSISIMNNQFHDIISCGVVSDTSSDILFFGNFMEGVHLHGFSAMGDSDNITVILNTILDCGIGFNFDDVRDVQVIGNWVNESMNHDINVDTCWEGLVYMNAFCSSDIDVGRASTNLFNWDNQTMGNYWMDYDGEDEDQNGIGDSPYEVSDGYQDNYPLTSLDLIHDFRSSCNISAYFWNTVENTNETETEPVAADTQTETLLIFNTSIQMFCVGVLLIILKRRYAT